MIFYKSCHNYGLDYNIYRHLLKKTKNDYYLYTWDYCHTKTMISSDFFRTECNINNTWNFGLKFNDTSKESIQNNSTKYGFGDYNISKYNDNQYIVKAISHLYTTEKYGQCQLINKEDIDKIDKTKFIIQPLLKNTYGEELNIFVFKHMNTNELFLISILVKHDTLKNINRKYNDCDYYFCELTDVFGDDNIKNLKNYCKSINLDFGRIELINDIERGWCIIDINNSPGGGPLTNKVTSAYINLFNTLL